MHRPVVDVSSPEFVCSGGLHNLRMINRLKGLLIHFLRCLFYVDVSVWVCNPVGSIQFRLSPFEIVGDSAAWHGVAVASVEDWPCASSSPVGSRTWGAYGCKVLDAYDWFGPATAYGK